MRTPVPALAACLALTLAACPKSEPNSMSDPDPPPVNLDKSNVVEIKTTVPYGQTVACSQFLDPAAVTAKLGETDPVTIVDLSSGNKEASSVCSVRKGGKLLTEAQQKKLLEKNGLTMGVQAGDEICQVRVFCSFPYDVASEKKRLEAAGQSCTEGEIGDLTCLQRVPIGPRDRIVVTVLDPEAQCRYVVNPTTLVDEEPMKLCARTFVELISKDALQGKAPATPPPADATAPAAPAPTK